MPTHTYAHALTHTHSHTRVHTCAPSIVQGFRPRVLCYDLHPRQDFADSVGATYVDLETLLRCAACIAWGCVPSHECIAWAHPLGNLCPLQLILSSTFTVVQGERCRFPPPPPPPLHPPPHQQGAPDDDEKAGHPDQCQQGGHGRHPGADRCEGWGGVGEPFMYMGMRGGGGGGEDRVWTWVAIPSPVFEVHKPIAQMLTVGEDGLSETGGKLFGVGLDV